MRIFYLLRILKEFRQTVDKRFSAACVCVMKDKMEEKQKANSIWFDLISRRYLLAITLNLELEESVFTNDVMVAAAVVPAPPPLIKTLIRHL